MKDIRRRDFEIDGILSGEIFGFDGILSATEFLRVYIKGGIFEIDEILSATGFLKLTGY